MYLDEILKAQKRGEARGVTSVCSAHPYVLKQTLMFFERPLIEATCNQVNQFGGYTGMTPRDFVRYIHRIARENNYPYENILLGGDHLGPSVWQAEPADIAMGKAEALIHDYVDAGFVKLHLDCSMPLADDPMGVLDVEVSAKRAARLASVAETASSKSLHYVIGTEVPIPGGAMEHGEGVCLTRAEDVRQTIEITREAFLKIGLHSAWERVIAVVVQPGVEFGDDFVLPYQPEVARELSLFIESQPLIYEAHSTDYQPPQLLKKMVQDHFAILKVGPALTFAFREGVFALAMIENELLSSEKRSNIISSLEKVMIEKSEYWVKYYHGDKWGEAFKRKYSLSDRIRYYWTDPSIQKALGRLMTNLDRSPIPATLLRQYVPDVCSIATPIDRLTPESIVLAKIQKVLEDYAQACQPN